MQVKGMVTGLGIAGLLIASPVGAQSASSGPSSSQVTGKVDKLDRTNNQLSLRLNVSDSTQVMKNGQPSALSDIKEGDQVRASSRRPARWIGST